MPEINTAKRKDFPGGSDGKASAYNVGDLGSIPGLGRSPGEGNGNPLQFLPGKSHGWRSLVGYSSWGRKESDTTERLHSLMRKEEGLNHSEGYVRGTQVPIERATRFKAGSI